MDVHAEHDLEMTSWIGPQDKWAAIVELRRGADLARSEGDATEAADLLDRALELACEMAEDNPDVVMELEMRRTLHMLRGSLHDEQKATEAAAANYAAARDCAQRVTDLHGGTYVDVWLELAKIEELWASIAVRRRDALGAASSLESALSAAHEAAGMVLSREAAREELGPTFEADVRRMLNRLGDLLTDLGLKATATSSPIIEACQNDLRALGT